MDFQESLQSLSQNFHLKDMLFHQPKVFHLSMGFRFGFFQPIQPAT